VKIFLIRHGHALKRSEWTDADLLRPLSTRGERQASGIQAMLRKVPLRRICSSPALRCRETVERLATDHLLPVELDPRLAGDADDALDLAGALELLDDKGGLIALERFEETARFDRFPGGPEHDLEIIMRLLPHVQEDLGQ